MSAMFAVRLLPPMSSRTRLKRNGVASYLATPCSFASATPARRRVMRTRQTPS
jgi:hypothetical protein